MEKYKVLKEQLKILGLDAINEEFYSKAQEYRKKGLDYIDYLAELISTQISRHVERSINYRLSKARFPVIKRIEEFNFRFQPELDEKAYRKLLDFEFVRDGENVIFIGPPGVGKSHLAISLGVKACEHRIRTYFIQTSDLVEELKIAKISKTLSSYIDKLSRQSLLIIDELGYSPLSPEDANLFFQLVSRKYEKTSIVITSNKNFQDWGSIFNDEVIAAAIIDRLLHHCHLFVINGPSYRIKDKVREGNLVEKEED